MSFSSTACVYDGETERTLVYSSINGTYAKVGSATINAAIQFVLQNQTDVAVSFSKDGANSFITLAAGASFTSDVQTNRSDRSEMCMLPAGTQWWVNTAGSPSTGAAYVTIAFANNRGNK
jgi:hypothetical protein